MKKQDEIIIIGAGGHSKVIADIAKLNNYKIIGYLDDNATEDYVIGKISDLNKYCDKKVFIAIGNNEVRKEIAGKYPDLNYINLIHPSCVIFDTVKMGIGNVIMPLVVINSNAVLGNHCIINSASVVEHDCVLGDFVHVSPNATLCGKVQVNECTHLGAASVVKNNINICGNCVIGAGSTVIADIENPGVYVGLISKKYLNQNRL